MTDRSQDGSLKRGPEPNPNVTDSAPSQPGADPEKPETESAGTPGAPKGEKPDLMALADAELKKRGLSLDTVIKAATEGSAETDAALKALTLQIQAVLALERANEAKLKAIGLALEAMAKQTEGLHVRLAELQKAWDDAEPETEKPAG